MTIDCKAVINRYAIPIGDVPKALGIPDDALKVRVYVNEEELVIDLFFEPDDEGPPFDADPPKNADATETATDAPGRAEEDSGPADQSEAERSQAPAERGEAQANREEPPKGGPLAKAAGMMCAETGFRTFLKTEKDTRVADADEAANWLREYCGVTSRAMLDHDEAAAAKFKGLDAEYFRWLNA